MTEYKAEIRQGDIDGLFDKLDGFRRPDVIRDTLKKSALFLVRWVKRRRLSGRRFTWNGIEGLNVVSGRLRSSISASGVIQTANEYKVRIGTNVEYAPVHEFGHTFNRGARSSLRVQNRYKRGSRKGRFKKGSSFGRGFTFGASTQTIPARPFLTPAITDEKNRQAVLGFFIKRIQQELKGKK